jgi:hypothetical protein
VGDFAIFWNADGKNGRIGARGKGQRGGWPLGCVTLAGGLYVDDGSIGWFGGFVKGGRTFVL